MAFVAKFGTGKIVPQADIRVTISDMQCNIPIKKYKHGNRCCGFRGWQLRANFVLNCQPRNPKERCQGLPPSQKPLIAPRTYEDGASSPRRGERGEADHGGRPHPRRPPAPLGGRGVERRLEDDRRRRQVYKNETSRKTDSLLANTLIMGINGTQLNDL